MSFAYRMPTFNLHGVKDKENPVISKGVKFMDHYGCMGIVIFFLFKCKAILKPYLVINNKIINLKFDISKINLLLVFKIMYFYEVLEIY